MVDFKSMVDPTTLQRTSELARSIASLTQQQAVKNYADKIDRLFAVLGEAVPGKLGEHYDNQEGYGDPNTRYAVQLAGGSVAGWSMMLSPEAFTYTTGLTAGTSNFCSPLLKTEYNNSPAGEIAQAGIGGPPQFGYPEMSNEDCQKVRDLSLKATASLNPSKLPTQPVPANEVESLDAQAIITRCVYCHQGAAPSSTVPPIPFDNVPQLRHLLLTSALKEKIEERFESSDLKYRMPPSPHRALTKEEEESFLAFIDRVLEE